MRTAMLRNDLRPARGVSETKWLIPDITHPLHPCLRVETPPSEALCIVQPPQGDPSLALRLLLAFGCGAGRTSFPQPLMAILGFIIGLIGSVLAFCVASSLYLWIRGEKWLRTKKNIYPGDSAFWDAWKRRKWQEYSR